MTPAVPFFTATGLYTSITSLPDLISYSPSPKNILVKGGKLWPYRYGVLSGKASKCSINVPACEITQIIRLYPNTPSCHLQCNLQTFLSTILLISRIITLTLNIIKNIPNRIIPPNHSINIKIRIQSPFFKTIN